MLCQCEKPAEIVVNICSGPAIQVPLEKAGFHIIRQGKHIVMSDGTRQVTLPRHNPIKAFTMGGIVQDAGLTIEEFRKLL